MHAMLEVAVVQAGLLLVQHQSLEHAVIAAEVRMQDLLARMDGLAEAQVLGVDGSGSALEAAHHAALGVLTGELRALISGLHNASALSASGSGSDASAGFTAASHPAHRSGMHTKRAL